MRWISSKAAAMRPAVNPCETDRAYGNVAISPLSRSGPRTPWQGQPASQHANPIKTKDHKMRRLNLSRPYWAEPPAFVKKSLFRSHPRTRLAVLVLLWHFVPITQAAVDPAPTTTAWSYSLCDEVGYTNGVETRLGARGDALDTSIHLLRPHGPDLRRKISASQSKSLRIF